MQCMSICVAICVAIYIYIYMSVDRMLLNSGIAELICCTCLCFLLTFHILQWRKSRASFAQANIKNIEPRKV